MSRQAHTSNSKLDFLWKASDSFTRVLNALHLYLNIRFIMHVQHFKLLKMCFYNHGAKQPMRKRTLQVIYRQYPNFVIYIFFNVGPPKESTFLDHLLWSIFQFILHKKNVKTLIMQIWQILSLLDTLSPFLSLS